MGLGGGLSLHLGRYKKMIPAGFPGSLWFFLNSFYCRNADDHRVDLFETFNFKRKTAMVLFVCRWGLSE